MIRVADYVAGGLAAHGIRHVFMVTGGAAMHLNDAIGRCRDLEYVCVHHEQAASMAAQGYYRLTNRLAAVNVTAGPGATNAITGVFGAWTDSLGMVVDLGPGEVGDAGAEHGAAAPPAGRPGGGHRPPGRADHQVRRAGGRPRADPLPPGARDSPRAERPAGARLARHPGQRAVGRSSIRGARGLHARRGRTPPPTSARPRAEIARGLGARRAAGAAGGRGRAARGRGRRLRAARQPARRARGRPASTRTTCCRPTIRCTSAARARSATGPATSRSRTRTTSLILGCRLRHPAGELRLAALRPRRDQGDGGRGRGRAGEADAGDRPAGARRRRRA